MPHLRRTSDGEGESGARSDAIKYDENGRNPKVIGNRPIVGASMLVGSITARSYSDRDWWLTTAVTEIIEDKGDYVLFKTGNSTYEWRV